MEWLIAHLPLVLSVGVSIVSEVLSVIQQLQYPTNSGVGGILSSVLKVLQALGSKSPS